MGDEVTSAEALRHERNTGRLTGATGNASGTVSGAASSATLAAAGAVVSTPAVVLRPLDVVGRVQTGTFGVAVPMRAGHVFGDPNAIAHVTVRNDTWASVQLAITDGKVDRKRTQIEFKTSDGKDTDLDGPLWWNAERIYIDDNGQIRAEVPCYPDPNITEHVLGPDHARIPDHPQELLRLLGAAALPEPQLLGATQRQIATPDPTAVAQPAVARPATTGGAEGVREPTPEPQAEPQAEPSQPRAPAAAAARATPAAAATPARVESPASPATAAANDDSLHAVLDVARLRMSFEGTFKPGPITFGDGATIELAEGAHATVSGTLDDVRADLDAPVRRSSFRAQGTELDTGAGRLAFSVRTRNGGETELQLNTLETQHLRFVTPATGGAVHRLEMGGRRAEHGLRISAAEGAPPLIRTSVDADGTRQLAVELPRMALDDLRGEVLISDALGNPATMTLGGEATDPMRVEGSLSYDSQREHFAFDSNVTALQARIRDLALVEAQGFDMSLREMSVRGAGRVAFSSTNGRGSLELEASGEPWEVDAQIEDAKLGVDSAEASISADLSSDTRGTLRLQRLAYASGEHPQLEGTARLRVALDGLQAQIGRDTFSIKPGQQADLVIDRMAWGAGDVSPELRAKLVLDVSGDAFITPERVAGLRGAEVRVVGGRTLLMLDVTLQPDGTLDTDVGITLHAVELRTRHSHGGGAAAQEVTLPAEPLPAEVPPVRLRAVQPPDPPRRRPAGPPPEVVIPAVPELSISPQDVLGALSDTSLTLTVPAKRLSTNVLNVDNVRTTSTAWVDDDVGIRYRADISRPSGDIRLALDIAGGRLQPNTSRLTLNPPLELEVSGSVLGRGPVALSASESLFISAVIIKRDPVTGRGYLWPEVSFDGLFGEAAELIGQGDRIRGALGDKLAEALFGSSRFSLERDDLLATLGRHTSALGERIVIAPGRPARRISGPAAPPASPPSNSTPPTPPAATPPPASTTPKPPPAAPAASGPAAAILQALNLEQARVDVQRSRFSATTLDLGGGQKISFRDGTELTLSGNLDDFTISGTAQLGELNLGVDGENHLGLTEGSANLRIRVRRNPGGSPSIDVEISNLSAQGASFATSLGGATLEAKDARIRQGTVHFTSGGGRASQLTLDMEDVSANLTASGRSGAAGVTGRAELLRAQVEGSLRLENGGIAGELRQVSLQGQGLALGGGGSGAEAGFLNLSGGARLSTDARGQIHLARLSGQPPLTLSTSMRFDNGAALAINGGSAELITLSSDFSTVKLHGLQADVSARVELGAPTADGQRRLLQIHSGRIERPSVPAGTDPATLPALVLGANRVSTVGNLPLRNLSASITNIGPLDTANGSLDVSQIDFNGDTSIGLTEAGAWSFVRTPGRPALRAVAQARSASFTNSSPQLHLVTQPGANLTTEVEGLWLGPSLSGVRMSLRNTHIEAAVEEGELSVAPAGSPLETVQVGRGTRVAADLEAVDLGTGNLGDGRGGAALRLRGNLRVEGTIEDNTPAIDTEVAAAEGHALQIKPAHIGGTFRLIVGTRYDDGAFSANSHALVDATAQGGVRGQLRTDRLRDILRRHSEQP